MSDLNNETALWESKPVKHWSPDDRIYWICKKAELNNIDYEQFNLQNLANTSNEELLSYTSTDIQNTLESHENPDFFYEIKENLMQLGHDYDNTSESNTQLSLFSQENRIITNTQSSEISTSNQVIKRGPGRPRSINSIHRNKEKRSKLWEFLIQLLCDKNTCPSLIKWVNYEEGVFQFVQSNKVAELWGARNQRSHNKMNYEKFSRALRYHYRNNVLLPVSQKRLAYKFGPEAKGWRTAKPILSE